MKKGQYLETILRSPKTVFTFQDVSMLWGESGTQIVRVRLNYYVNCGKLYRVRRGLYAKDKNYNRLELATRIHTPSYVSFETVLTREGLIFQFHAQISVASYLTRDMEVDGQIFSFRKIKTSILINPMGVKNQDETSFATRERAFLDTLYIHNNYHFDNISGLDWKVVFEILPLYQNQRMSNRIRELYKHATHADGE